MFRGLYLSTILTLCLLTAACGVTATNLMKSRGEDQEYLRQVAEAYDRPGAIAELNRLFAAHQIKITAKPAGLVEMEHLALYATVAPWFRIEKVQLLHRGQGDQERYFMRIKYWVSYELYVSDFENRPDAEKAQALIWKLVRESSPDATDQ